MRGGYMSHAPSITQALTFLTRQTGQEELTLLRDALHVGLNVLYERAVEQAFIEEGIARDEAIAVLGRERVEEIEYANG